ncbi:MAG TPA: LytTR family DNA-binding domain-containing protein [Bacteroidales bacterium]
MNAVIIEDEFLAARNLLSILDETGEVKVIATLESIAETEEWFHTHSKPDIVFMDIHLADGSAFEIFERIHVSCPVIFTTAYDEYALKAFKVNSIDYLLKPIEGEAVKKALQKLKTLTGHADPQSDLQKIISLFKTKASYKTNFLVPVKGDKLIPLNVEEIALFYISDGVIKAQTFDDKTYTLEYTLEELTGLLNPEEFFRANRQFIVGRNAIRDLDLWFNSRISVNVKVTVPEKILISKARVFEFKSWFTGQ